MMSAQQFKLNWRLQNSFRSTHDLRRSESCVFRKLPYLLFSILRDCHIKNCISKQSGENFVQSGYHGNVRSNIMFLNAERFKARRVSKLLRRHSSCARVNITSIFNIFYSRCRSRTYFSPSANTGIFKRWNKIEEHYLRARAQRPLFLGFWILQSFASLEVVRRVLKRENLTG